MIVLREPQPIGYIRINWMGEPGLAGWLRFGLGERRGEGHMSTALRCLLTHLFANGLHRMDAEVYEYNVASLRLLERLELLLRLTFI